MIKTKVQDIEWHDAEIHDFQINSNNDAYDTIKLIISSDAFIRDYKNKTVCIVLDDVFKAKINLNMWLSGKDTINTVSILEDSKWINEETKKFIDGFGPKKIFHLVINTNTNSTYEFLLTKELLISY